MWFVINADIKHDKIVFNSRTECLVPLKDRLRPSINKIHRQDTDDVVQME